MSLRRALTLAALVLVLGTVTLLSLVGEPSAPPGGSARSSEADGRRAAFLLLAELGFAPELWDRPPGELLADRGPDAVPGLLWLPVVPRGFDPEVAPDDPLERARARGGRSWARYREFAAAGGVLVLPAVPASAEFLVAGLGLAEQGTAPFELEGSPDLAAGLGERAQVAEGDARIEELTDWAGSLVARRIPVGDGACVLVAAGAWQDNRGLELPEHGLLLVRLIERLTGGGPLRFDESVFSGTRAGDSALALAFGTGGLLTWHLLALLALLVWGAAWVREFPRDPEPHETLSPLLRASSTAAWLGRHGRFDALAGMLRSGTLEALGARADERLTKRGAGRAAAQRAAVAALAARHGRAGEAERWIELLAARPVADAAGLEALDRDLRRLQAENTAGTRRLRVRAGREQE